MEQKKKCNMCKEDKKLSEFNNMKSSPDGKQRKCKKCQREYEMNLRNPKQDEVYFVHDPNLATI
jgi:hypothetical protein